MKKIFLISILSLSFTNFIFIKVLAKSYKINDVIENSFSVSKNFGIDLPKGEWILVEKHYRDYYDLRFKSYTLARLEKDRLVESIEIGRVHTAAVYEWAVNSALQEILFKDKYDGCYERPEYSILRFYTKGNTHNCFWVRHIDVYSELFTPEDPNQKNAYRKARRWIKKNQIQLPEIMLLSEHSYFSRLKAGYWYTLSYGIDPKILGAPKNKFRTEKSSEYHKYNIENYPKHKKIMNMWASISAKRHKDFEKTINIVDRHKLELDDLFLKENIKNEKNSSDISSQIQKLYDLYKNGVLSKDEFDKAKKKLLN